MQSLIKVCDREINKYYDALGGLDLKIYEDKKQVIWKILTRMSKIEIVYLKKATILHAPSVLYARIFPRKNDPFFFLTHEIKRAGEPLGSALIFSYIEDERRMSSCITTLLKRIEELLPNVQTRAEAEADWQDFRGEKRDEIFRILEVAEKDIPEDVKERETYENVLCELYEGSILLPRFANMESPYMRLLTGKVEKATKEYGKWEQKNTLTDYEQRLFLAVREENKDVSLLFSENDSVSDIFPFVTSAAEGKQILLGSLFCFIIFSVLFCILLYGLQTFFSEGTIFYAGMPWYFGCLLAGLPAMFGSIALQRFIIPILYPKKKEKMLLADKMINGPKTSIFANVVFVITIVGCIAVALVFAFDHIAFYEDHLTFQDSNALPPVITYEFSYTDIKELYKIEGRYNDYGDYIDRASYVLCFEDGIQLDLDGYISVEVTEGNVLPIITPYTGEPVVLESDRDIFVSVTQH